MNKQSSLVLIMLTSIAYSQVQSTSCSPKRLVFTDSVKATMPTNTSFAAISQDGSKVFFKPFGGFASHTKFPPGFVPAPPFTQAVLYKNVNGKLQVEKSIPLELNTFPFSDGGGASPDFTRFVIIDDDEKSSVTVRIRTLDANFNVIATKIDSTIDSIGFPVFTEDNKFFAVPAHSKNKQSILRLYETNTLNIVFQKDLGFEEFNQNGLIDSGLITYFTITKNGKQFEYFGFPNAFVDISLPSPSTKSATLNIFQLNRAPSPTLTLANKTSLPQQTLSISSLQTPKGKKLPYAIVALTTMRADLPNEVITYQVPQPSVLPKDGDELRMYKITVGKNGKIKVKLIASQNLKMDGGAIAVYPLNKGKTIANSQRNTPLNIINNVNLGYDGATQPFSLREITCRPTDRVAKLGFNYIDQLYSVSNENNFAQFSANGKWLIASGCKGGQNINPPTPADQAYLGTNNNLDLFRVCN